MRAATGVSVATPAGRRGPEPTPDAPADNDKKEQAVDQPLPSVCARLGPRDHHALKAAAMRRLLNEGIDDLLGAAGDDSVEVFECLRWWQRSRPRLDLRPELLLNEQAEVVGREVGRVCPASTPVLLG